MNSKVKNDGSNLIGDVVKIRFTSLPGSPSISAKVDTGCDISSLNCQSWKIEDDKVAFVCKELSDNVLRLPLVDHQAVKSAMGTSYRPIVELSIKINDTKVMTNVQFNLADRKGMEYSVLVGKNILQNGGFLIDPSMTEAAMAIPQYAPSPNGPNPELGPKRNSTQSMVSNQTPSNGDNGQNEQDVKQQQLQQLYDLMQSSDITFSDLVKFIRAQVTKTFEDIEY